MAGRNEDPIFVIGSKEEGERLKHRLLKECGCKMDPIGRRIFTCEGHQTLLKDPNGLIIQQRRWEKLRERRGT